MVILVLIGIALFTWIVVEFINAPYLDDNGNIIHKPKNK